MRESVSAESAGGEAHAASAHASAENIAARRRNQRVHHGTSEPPTVALLRHVLNPAVIVLSLLFCVILYAQEPTPAYFALAALAFLIA